MTTQEELLRAMTLRLEDARLEDARAECAACARHDARELMLGVLDVPRSWLHTHRMDPVSEAQQAALWDAVERRRRGAPVAYAAQRAAFRRLSLYVDERVLIPRPETEQLVDIALAEAEGGGTAVDVGTGSGAIALALAMEGRFERIVATDVSMDALAVARENWHALSSTGALAHGRVEMEFRSGSGLAPCATGEASLIVSNPPYIAPREAAQLPPAVRDWEPAVALLAGDDGLAIIARIARDAPRVLSGGGLVAFEVDARRAGRAAEIVGSTVGLRDVSVRPDLTGRARFVVARRSEE
jgi:release factor glutamine methyltransferase